MPITIVQPSGTGVQGSANTVLEVGHLLRARTDFVGPLSEQAFWTFEAWLNADSEHFAMRRKYRWTQNEISQFAWSAGINNAAQDGEGLGFRFTTTAPGNATFRVQLDDPASTFHEQAQVIVQMTAPFDIVARAAQTSTGVSGFTEEDRSDLLVVKSSVQVPLPINTAAGAVAQTALGSFVQSAPLQLLTRQECRTITGSGTLTRPAPGFNVNALGFSWDFLSVPPYFGQRPGALREYEQRIVQFLVVQRDFGGNERITQVVDATSDAQFLTWGLNAPFRIDYNVTPGCQVQFCWLLLLG